MGLDQYANARKGEATIDEDGYKQWADTYELAYWRKHPNLQGFMEALYIAKGGTDEFNCVDVELTDADLDRLEADIKGNNLPDTGGFFFGSNSDDSYKEGDLDFIHDAREHLSMGYKIMYTSWW